MTTIAYDGKTLASDGGMVMAGMKIRYADKLRRLANGDLLGFAGQIDTGPVVMDWIEAGDLSEAPVIPKGGDADVIWIKKNGEIWTCDQDGIVMRIADTVFAIGSGAPIALGALMAGANAKKAVELAILVDPNSGFDVITMRR